MSVRSQHSYACAAGFNLIEAAIVLAIIGLVVGGIWAAAAQVRERHREIETTNIIVTAIDKLANLLKDVPANTYTDEYSLYALAVDSKAIPANGKTPYGAILVTYEADFGGRDFKLSLSGITPDACINILTRIAAGPSAAQLSRVIVMPTNPGYFTSFPVHISSIISQCSITTGSIIIQSKY